MIILAMTLLKMAIFGLFGKASVEKKKTYTRGPGVALIQN